MPNKVRKVRAVAVENVVVINSINPAVNPNGIFPIEMIEVAMIDSHRFIWLAVGAGYSNGSIVSISADVPVPESDPG